MKRTLGTTPIAVCLPRPRLANTHASFLLEEEQGSLGVEEGWNPTPNPRSSASDCLLPASP